MAAAARPDEINPLVYTGRAPTSAAISITSAQPQALPNGTTAHYGRRRADRQAAAQPDVAFIQEMKFPGDLPKLPEGPAPRANTDLGVLKARLGRAKAGAQIATVTRPAADPPGLPTGSMSWTSTSRRPRDLGYTGDGVQGHGYHDSGIDFAHPDLQGTMARDTDPASPYYGWPIAVLDSASMLSLRTSLSRLFHQGRHGHRWRCRIMPTPAPPAPAMRSRPTRAMAAR